MPSAFLNSRFRAITATFLNFGHVRALRWRRECFVGHNRGIGRSPQERADTNAELPAWIKPHLCHLAKEAPTGENWAHELKFDGYRIHARIDRTDVQLLTCTGVDWTDKYLTLAAALRTLSVRQAYLDGELCGVRPDGVTSFALIQNAADRRGGSDLLYFVFDLLYIDRQDLMPLPLSSLKARLAALLERPADAVRYSDHQIGHGQAFHRHACELGLEGIVSKQLDAGYRPGQRGLWLKTKCLNRRNSWSSAGPIPRAAARPMETLCRP
jgi:bifunctional non-homologous end joining protein LigD